MLNQPAPRTEPLRRIAGRVKSGVEHIVGGPARARVVILFACVLALESADAAAVGAAAPQLERSLHISNAQLGLLAATSTLMGAVITVPAGALTDKLRRVKLLVTVVGLWGVAMAASAAAPGYGWLLISRLALGGIAGAAGALIASLMGDFFPSAERAKIYGYVLSGLVLLAARKGYARDVATAVESQRAISALPTSPGRGSPSSGSPESAGAAGDELAAGESVRAATPVA